MVAVAVMVAVVLAVAVVVVVVVAVALVVAVVVAVAVVVVVDRCGNFPRLEEKDSDNSIYIFVLAHKYKLSSVAQDFLDVSAKIALEGHEAILRLGETLGRVENGVTSLPLFPLDRTYLPVSVSHPLTCDVGRLNNCRLMPK